MTTPEDREEIGVGADLRVELDPDDLDVVGGSGADQLVVGIGDVTLRVANLSLHHSGHTLKRQLHPPETPGSELRELEPGLIRTVRVRVQSRVVVGNAGGASDLLRNARHCWSSSSPTSLTSQKGQGLIENL